jgi:hypothetical protein
MSGSKCGPPPPRPLAFLAVQPDDFPEWTLASLEGSVLEALELAKIRAVDPDIALGTIAPRQIETKVKSFQALSDTEAFVLTIDGNFWYEHGPFGNVPPNRDHVDSNVSSFQALSSTEVLVLDTSNQLWLEHGPFGTIAPVKQRIDAGQPTLPVPPAPPPKPTTTTVPDLSGSTPAQATAVLKARGLTASFVGVVQGSVKVSSQSPAANQVVAIGSVVTVHWVKGPVNTQ